MICWRDEARARVVTLADAFAAPPHALLEDDGPDLRYEGSIDLDLVEGKRLQTGLGGADRPVGILGHRLWRHAKVFRRPMNYPGSEKPGREENVAAETIIASNQSFSASA
jgi:hypothetical protein